MSGEYGVSSVKIKALCCDASMVDGSPLMVRLGRAEAATWILKSFVKVAPTLSATCTVKLKSPAVAGVPPMVPVLEPSTSPVGSAPLLIDQPYGGFPPAAVKVVDGYAVPTAPSGKGSGVVMVRSERSEEHTSELQS